MIPSDLSFAQAIDNLSDRLKALECIEKRRPDYEILLHNRIKAIEAKLDPPPAIATTLWDQEVDKRIKALEDTHPEDLKDVAQHVTDIFVTIAKQREANEALRNGAIKVVEALREALK